MSFRFLFLLKAEITPLAPRAAQCSLVPLKSCLIFVIKDWIPSENVKTNGTREWAGGWAVYLPPLKATATSALIVRRKHLKYPLNLNAPNKVMVASSTWSGRVQILWNRISWDLMRPL